MGGFISLSELIREYLGSPRGPEGVGDLIPRTERRRASPDHNPRDVEVCISPCFCISKKGQPLLESLAIFEV